MSSNSAVEHALQLTQVLAEAVVGYRKRLVDGGISSEAADEMAKEFHSTMMSQVAARKGLRK